MNSKAIRKQLLAAVAMVLVAAVALGSSTYAWFVTNSTVTADGMKVQATAENGIEIQEVTTNSTWASAATGLHGTPAALVPTSTTDTSKWYHASALAKDASTVDTTTIEELTLVAENTTSYVGKKDASDSSGYYIHDQFKVRATNSNASNLVVSNIEVTGTTDALSPGLRVLVKCGTVVYICAPIDNATYTYEVGTDRTPTTAYSPDDFYTQMATTPLAATVTKDGIQVDVYTYFEGEDGEIYTDHIPDTATNLSVTLQFTATV